MSASPGNWTQSNEEYWLMRNVTHGVWARIRGFPGSTAGCKAGACLPKLHLLPPAFKSRLKQRRVHFLYIWTLIYEWKHLFFSPWKFRLTSVNLNLVTVKLLQQSEGLYLPNQHRSINQSLPWQLDRLLEHTIIEAMTFLTRSVQTSLLVKMKVPKKCCWH